MGTRSVTAFGKLVRTTAFRLTLVYLLLFAMFAASLLAYFAWNTRRLITEEITQTVNAETSEINEIYGRRGLRALVLAIEYRALRPGANLYLVTTPTGQSIAGNVGSLPPGVMAGRGWCHRRPPRGSGGAARHVRDRLPADRGCRLSGPSCAGPRHLIGKRLPASDRTRSGRAATAVRHRGEGRAVVDPDRRGARPWRRHLCGAQGFEA